MPAVLLVLVATTACTPGEERPPELGPLTVQDGDFTTAVAYQGKSVHSSADLGLCVEEGHAIELVSLTAVDATDGASVSDFDVVTVDSEASSDYPRRLGSINTWVSHERLVDEVCGESIVSLAIELGKRTQIAVFPSFVLAYRAGGDEYEVPVEFPVTLCTDLDAPYCEP